MVEVIAFHPLLHDIQRIVSDCISLDIKHVYQEVNRAID